MNRETALEESIRIAIEMPVKDMETKVWVIRQIVVDVLRSIQNDIEHADGLMNPQYGEVISIIDKRIKEM